MGKTPFWYGRRGGINTFDDLNRLLYGEGKDFGTWKISGEKRDRYPWLVNGYLNSLQAFPIKETIVTLHPPGYDADTKKHFVSRIYTHSHDPTIIQAEIKLGTTLLRFLNEETSPSEIIRSVLNIGKMEIGASYILEGVLEKDHFHQLILLADQLKSE